MGIPGACLWVFALRTLHKDQLGRLGRPAWGKADPDAEFARGFGRIHTRTQSGLGFLGENHYADCNNLIKYPRQVFIEGANNKYGRILINPTYRRFYFDGELSGRFELGFRLNDASVNHIEMVAPESRYDSMAIARGLLRAEGQVCLLDGRTSNTSINNMHSAIVEGYLLSSTKIDKIHQYDVLSNGKQYVSVGKPFVALRAGSAAPLVPLSQSRLLFEGGDNHIQLARTGVHGQNYDALFIDSRNPQETAEERFVRIFYTQMRALTYAHSFYVRQVELEKINKPILLNEVISNLISRINSLSIGGTGSDEFSDAMSEIVKKADLNASRLAHEIESKTKQRPWVSRFWKILRYIDKKADKAIEAAAEAATKQALRGGL